MKLYRTTEGPIVESDGWFYVIPLGAPFGALLNHPGVRPAIADLIRNGCRVIDESAFRARTILPPIDEQEVWAAGVTYLRSKVARMEESKDAGGGTFYDKVYDAPRPELFFKSMAKKVVGPGQPVRIRKDSKWNVPEPELALVINPSGQIVGYTIGNDMSSRDIEGENPLYLPQAKVYDGACALGPCVLLASDPLPKEGTTISIQISRGGEATGSGGAGEPGSRGDEASGPGATVVFEGSASLAQMKRELPELVEYLYRESSFPNGAVLLTGTGVVPPDSFTLAPGDVVTIKIEGIGTLSNAVA